MYERWLVEFVLQEFGSGGAARQSATSYWERVHLERRGKDWMHSPCCVTGVSPPPASVEPIHLYAAQVLGFPVGEAMLGRVVDPLGRPLSGLDPLKAAPLDSKGLKALQPSLSGLAPGMEVATTCPASVQHMGRGLRSWRHGILNGMGMAVPLTGWLSWRQASWLASRCANGW